MLGGPFFASLIAHELGHAFTARRNGIEIDGIDLWLLGGLARFKQDSRSPGQEFAIAAAGPAVSLLLALVFAGLSLAVAGTDNAHGRRASCATASTSARRSRSSSSSRR